VDNDDEKWQKLLNEFELEDGKLTFEVLYSTIDSYIQAME